MRKGEKELHVTDLVVCKSKQLLPQPIPILDTPFLRQKLHNFIVALQKGASIPPNRVSRISILHK